MAPNKARLQASTEAVSPVIGVILMVAITVVLAAVVFYFVQSLSQPPDQTPSLALYTTDAGTTFTVIQADPGLDWSDFTATGCTDPTGSIDAGDQITGCSGTITLVHNPSNTVVYTYG